MSAKKNKKASTKLTKSVDTKKVSDLVSGSINDLGYDIVRIKFFRQNSTLQIMIERKDLAEQITFGDCEKVSRCVSAILDIEECILGRYSLEVSSPGADRPLVRLQDFSNPRFIGQNVKIRTATEVMSTGKKSMIGVLCGTDGDNVIVGDNVGNRVLLSFFDILDAKLIV